MIKNNKMYKKITFSFNYLMNEDILLF